MKFVLIIFRAYPLQSLLMLVAIMFAAIAEGFSITMLLPLFGVVLGRGHEVGGAQTQEVAASHNAFEIHVHNVLNQLGIEPSVGVLLAAVTFGILIRSILLLLARKRIGDTVTEFATNLRLTLLRSILASKWDYFHHQPVGRLAIAMGSETLRASQAYLYAVMIIASILQSLIYLTIGLLVHWQATLVALSAGIFSIMMLNFLVSMSRKLGARQTLLFRSLVSRLTDTLQSVRSLKAMARENLAESVMVMETDELNKTMRKAAYSSAALTTLQEPLFMLVIAIGIYFALVYWGMALVTVAALVVILGRVMKQMGSIQRNYQNMVMSESAYWSLVQTIDVARNAEEKLSGTKPASLKHSIRFEQVSYAFGEHAVLKDVTLDIPTGTLTTFIGPSGSGKTTILDLILGLYRPQSGRIIIDDTVLEDLDLRSWRRMIGYVPQEQILLHDSVMTNVTLNDPALSEEDAIRALQLASAWDFVSRMPGGIQASVGERGTKLSGGQRQRILIARALVYEPALLILDEPTSALDPQSETEICDTLYGLRGRYTLLAVTHRSSLVDAADQVFRIENGTVGRLAVPDIRGSLGTQTEVTRS